MLTIEELSQKVGCHIETCRYYEKLGFFQGSGDAGARNLYDDAHKHRLMFILKLRHLGFNLEQMSGLLNFSYAADESPIDDSFNEATSYLNLVNEKIGELQKMKESLTEVITNCAIVGAPHAAFRLSIVNKLTGENGSSKLSHNARNK